MLTGRLLRGRGGRTHLDRLVAFGWAGVVGLDTSPVDNHAAADRDAVGLNAQRLAVDRRDFGPDAGGPAQTAGLMLWRRDLYLARVGIGRKHRVQFFADQPFDVGRRIDRRVDGLAAHEVRYRRVAV